MLFETGSFTQPPVRTNFYEDEFRMMLASIHDRVSIIDNKTLDALEELLQMSELADETLKRRNRENHKFTVQARISV